MAPSKDPVKFVEEAIVDHQKRVTKFHKSVWKQVKSFLTPLQKFLKNILSAAKDLAETVGKKVINHITSTIRAILKFLEPIEKALKNFVLLGKRILATIRKEIDKSKVIRFLKTVVRKYVETMRKIVGLIVDLWKEIGILDAAMAVFKKFSTVLKFLFNWIDELVSGILNAVSKVKTLLTRAMKELMKQEKEAIRMLKDVAKLKVP